MDPVQPKCDHLQVRQLLGRTHGGHLVLVYVLACASSCAVAVAHAVLAMRVTYFVSNRVIDQLMNCR